MTHRLDINQSYQSVAQAATGIGARRIAALLLAATLASPASAQEQAQAGTTASLLEEIVVTSRKREELAQDVPLSITAYNAEQLEALKVRNLEDLTVSMPNVSLDDIGTLRAFANFSIRGLGINSSIPSIDPTVGVFIDGVYMGGNSGVLLDMFDIHSIEVLRGPQGTLFGRNVTGGAVLINTKKPTEELGFSVRAAADGNPNGDGGLSKYAMGSISGPIGDTLSFRFSAYYNKDDGWFENLATGENHGETETTIFRPVLRWAPSDEVELILRWEHMESDGQGPASQNHTNGSGRPGFFASFDRDSFDFSIDEPGFSDFENDLVTLELNWDVAFGDGTITNIFGWKDYSTQSRADIDAQPRWIFHADAWNYAEQYSNELRYNGRFGKANVTTGVFWFTNEIIYHERRNLLGALIPPGNVAPFQIQDGGGVYEVDSLAWFGSIDYDLNEAWTLTGGLRYTAEDKSAEIASLIRNISVLPFGIDRRCRVDLGTCTPDFVDDDSWNAWSGKLGATYNVSDQARIYGYWTRSQRSGGYNLRNTAGDTVNNPPGPFDEETVDSYELGYKSELSGRGRLNAAVFFTQVQDMQREINLPDPASGVVQVIKNTADADIWGVELDGMFALGSSTLLMASVGWVDPEYTKVFFDLNGDGAINEADEDLELPRAAKWTWSVGLNHDMEIGASGLLTGRISYAFRDDSFYTDNNLGYLLSQKILNAGLDFRTGNHWVFSLYGQNLLNEVNHGGDTQLPAVIGPVPTGGTFSPLAKGRIAGLEITYEY